MISQCENDIHSYTSKKHTALVNRAWCASSYLIKRNAPANTLYAVLDGQAAVVDRYRDPPF